MGHLPLGHPLQRSGGREFKIPSMSTKTLSSSTLVRHLLPTDFLIELLTHLIKRSHQPPHNRAEGTIYFYTGPSGPNILSFWTVMRLLAATHNWAEVLDRGGQTGVLFLDFSKAFDSVPHRRLLDKLRFYGIDGKHNSLISSLLQCRRQRVVINGASSSWAPVTSGVPQVTVIGPILFLIYINDIQRGISSQMRLFADDSIIYREIRNNTDHTTLSDDLHRLDQWAEEWQMIFKPEKRYVMNITKSNQIKSVYCHVNTQYGEKHTWWEAYINSYTAMGDIEASAYWSPVPIKVLLKVTMAMFYIITT